MIISLLIAFHHTLLIKTENYSIIGNAYTGHLVKEVATMTVEFGAPIQVAIKFLQDRLLSPQATLPPPNWEDFIWFTSIEPGMTDTTGSRESGARDVTVSVTFFIGSTPVAEVEVVGILRNDSPNSWAGRKLTYRTHFHPFHPTPDDRLTHEETVTGYLTPHPATLPNS
jgi:hypothetical protein